MRVPPRLRVHLCIPTNPAAEEEIEQALFPCAEIIRSASLDSLRTQMTTRDRALAGLIVAEVLRPYGFLRSLGFVRATAPYVFIDTQGWPAGPFNEERAEMFREICAAGGMGLLWPFHEATLPALRENTLHGYRLWLVQNDVDGARQRLEGAALAWKRRYGLDGFQAALCLVNVLAGRMQLGKADPRFEEVEVAVQGIFRATGCANAGEVYDRLLADTFADG